MPLALDNYMLPAGLLWSDELAWRPVGRVIKRGLTNAPIQQVTPEPTGRPITLTASPTQAWLTREELIALQTLTEGAGPFELTLWDGRTIDAIFAEQPYDYVEVIDYEDPTPTDLYALTAVRLISTSAMRPAPDPEE